MIKFHLVLEEASAHGQILLPRVDRVPIDEQKRWISRNVEDRRVDAELHGRSSSVRQRSVAIGVAQRLS